MTNDGTLGVGIIGASPGKGWAARSHVPALAGLDGFELAAVCTTRRESADAAASEFGARWAVTDPAELIALDDVDVVAVCVRVPKHHALVKLALQSGKHVYCEWPLGANVAEARELVELADRAGVSTAVGLQARQDPVLREVRRRTAQGEIGRVLSASLVASVGVLGSPTLPEALAWSTEASNGMNVMTVPASHAIDALFSWVGEPADVDGIAATQNVEVKIAETGETITATSPDQVLAIGRLTCGGLYALHVQGGARQNRFAIKVFGSEGTLEVTADGSGIQYGPLRLCAGGADDQGSLTRVEVPGDELALPTPAVNVSRLYAELGGAIAGGAAVETDFALALRRHEFLDALLRRDRRSLS
jgi:predicted dehydrogenase